MTRIRLLITSILGVLALTAIAATAASAEPTVTCTPTGNASHTLTTACIANAAGTALLTLGLPALETIELLATKVASTESKLVGEVSGAEITCAAATTTALLDGSPSESASLLQAVVTFTTCKTNLEGCKVRSAAGEGTIITTSLTGLALTASDGLIEFKPATGEIFATFETFGPECVASKVFEVKGSVEGTVLSGGKLEEGTDTATKGLDFEKVLGLTIAGGEATEFTLFLTAELDRPSTWSATTFAAHPAFGLFLTSEIP